MMRSNSKQPFWLTGDMTPAAALCAWRVERRGWAGVTSFMAGVEMGLAGVCGAPSAMVGATTFNPRA